MNELLSPLNTIPEKEHPEKTGEHLFFLVYNTHRTFCYQISFHITRNKQASEDIIQEVFINLWCHKEQLSTIKNLKAFVGTAARNLSIDYIRRQALAHHVINEYAAAQNNYLDLNEYLDR